MHFALLFLIIKWLLNALHYSRNRVSKDLFNHILNQSSKIDRFNNQCNKVLVLRGTHGNCKSGIGFFLLLFSMQKWHKIVLKYACQTQKTLNVVSTKICICSLQLKLTNLQQNVFKFDNWPNFLVTNHLVEKS